MIKDTMRIILLKTATKICVHSKVVSIYLMPRPFSVNELPPLVFKRFFNHNALFCNSVQVF